MEKAKAVKAKLMGVARSIWAKLCSVDFWTAIAVLICFAVIAVLLFVSLNKLYGIDLAQWAASEDNSKVSAAVIALVGVLATAMITLVGLLIKLSVDRTARLTQKAEEDRLRVDVAIKALGLLGTSGDDEQTKTQRSGAVFTLAILGQLELALSMVHTMWSQKNQIHSSTAILIVEKGLRSLQYQGKAAHVLFENAHKLVSPAGELNWPGTCVDVWDELGDNNRVLCLEGLARALVSRPLEEWEPGYLRRTARNMHLIMKKKAMEPHTKSSSALIGYVVASVLKDDLGEKLLSLGINESIPFEEMQSKTESVLDQYYSSWIDNSVIVELENWSHVSLKRFTS